MKSIKFCLFLLITFILTSIACKTPQKLYGKGDYDGAIKMIEERMRQKRFDEEDIKLLVEAFNHVNVSESEKLTRLRAEQRTDNKWTEILQLAKRIQARQDLIKPYIPNDDAMYFGLLQDLRMTNVDYAITESKEGAAEFYYKRGYEELLLARRGDRPQARIAYDDFAKTIEFLPLYKDAVKLKEESYRLAINHAYFRVENESRMIMPAEFESQIKNVFVRDLNTKWVKYHTYKDTALRYEYDIIQRITRIEISPERNDNNRWTEEAEVEDGFTYEYDGEGRIKKDTAGNEIKTKKYAKVKAELFEVRQFKEARVFGFLEYFDNRTREKVMGQPIEVNGVFQNVALRYEGDKRALKKETSRRLGGSIKAYPSDADMLLLVTENMKRRTKSLMDENGYILER